MQSDIHKFSSADLEPLLETLGISGRPSLRAIIMLAIIAGVIGLTALIGENARTATALAGVTALIAIVAWLTPAFSRRKLRQWIQRHSGCSAIVAWDDQAFQTGGCVHNEDCSFPWQAILSAIVSQEYMILQTRRGPVIVPRRALNDQQSWDLQRRFVDYAIPVRQVGN